MTPASGARRRWGRLVRGGVMLIAGALGIGACDHAGNAVPYGTPPDGAVYDCTSDDDCVQRYSSDWYCDQRDDGGTWGTCVRDTRKDGGGAG